MLLDVERLAQSATCPCCQAHGQFIVELNCSLQVRQCHVVCKCSACDAQFVVDAADEVQADIDQSKLICSAESGSCWIEEESVLKAA